ncbi:MAG: hypothetical protein U9R03_02655 [Candidatus Aerophobetes bacterium]|nr:hypothetical protein [Candidatus Aerophobetes bacterium]
MNIGFFDTCLDWVPHFETDLELIDYHLQRGDKITWFNCNGELPFCQANPYHRKRKCQSCIKRKNKGIKLYADKIEILNWNINKNNFKCEIPKVNSVDELKSLYHNNFDIGLSTLSSLISVIRDPKPNLTRYESLWHRIYKTAYLSYDKMSKVLDGRDFDRIYIFNGRFALEKSVLRACENHKIEYYTHDRGRNKNFYMLYKNSLPNNRIEKIRRINKAWNDQSVSNEKKEEIGKSFYRERMIGKDQFWISFVHGMKKNHLPKKFDYSKNNITIFTSSEDELVAISDEWKNPIYDSQIIGINKIIEDAPNDINFYLRLHPNLIGIKNNDLSDLKSIDFPNLTIIPPESKIDTYALIKASNKIITFGSTVGIEASFLGKPSILAGVSYYLGLNATYEASNHNHVIKLLKSDLLPKKIVPTLMYGYYQKTFGYKFNNYDGKNFYIGKYKGKYLYGNFFVFITMKILSSMNILGNVKRIIKRYGLRLYVNKIFNPY